METIKTKEGYVFASKDKSIIFSNEIILGKTCHKDDYIEITIKEAEEINNKFEEEFQEYYKQKEEI